MNTKKREIDVPNLPITLIILFFDHEIVTCLMSYQLYYILYYVNKLFARYQVTIATIHFL
jgi:hypothetical protein